MRAILAICGNTIKEGLRNKLFYILLIIGLLFILMGRMCMQGDVSFNSQSLSPQQVVALATTISFHIIIFWGLTLAGLLSMGAVLGDIETGVITVFIAKPISRFEYLLGKFFGVMGVVLLNVIVLGCGFFLLAYLKTDIWPFKIFLSLAVFILNLMLLVSVVMLVSLISSRIVAMLMGIVGYLFSVGIDIPVYFDALRAQMVEKPAVLILSKIIYFAFPQWGSTQFYAASFLSDMFAQKMSFWPTIHTAGYIVLVWLGMMLLFNKKEL
ncbi:MAG: ABC transporter permease subunit [Deltaproteobacteria bacterium]|nr:ABC transporter permease subunit [Candidatus Zymogenaceae bacterium]